VSVSKSHFSPRKMKEIAGSDGDLKEWGENLTCACV
jgi:hypothetical protein